MIRSPSRRIRSSSPDLKKCLGNRYISSSSWRLAGRGEPAFQISARLGRAPPHVEERGMVAVEDQIDVVHVQRKGLDVELVDADAGAGRVPTGAGLDGHALRIP